VVNPAQRLSIVAHSYQFTFEPNPNWSGFYAGSKEICDYLQNTTTKYGVDRFVKTEHKVTRCFWDDVAKKW